MSATLTPAQETNSSQLLKKASLAAFDLFLVTLLLIGIFFRFNWVNWNQDTDLHPDEYGLTGTLTQLRLPQDLAEYFNTRLSPLSPYQKYDQAGSPTVRGADNRMRWGQWPITLIRATAELTGNSGYGEMRLLGRSLAALADSLSVLLIFLIGERLYRWRVGLLAAALSSLAVMQIQQSHFMTVDNFGGLFTTLALYACVRIAQSAPVYRPRAVESAAAYRPAWRALGWYALFGIAFGMALASKVNLLPVGGLALVATLISIADLKLRSMDDLRQIFGFAALFLFLGLAVAGLVFRITQPMSFRAPTGETTPLTMDLNPDWVESMKVAQAESSGIGGGPPGEQWAHRPVLIFPLVNMIVWGMGLPLGLACWTAFGAALWQLFRGKNWRAHLLPLVWAGGYFLFMGTRWVMSVRYFLPIYPFLCLLAAWGLLELWQSARLKPVLSAPRILAGAILGIVLFGTLAWANAFTQAVYATPHTRLQATHWIYQNIAGPLHLALQDGQGQVVFEPLPAPDGLQINAGTPYQQPFVLPVGGQLTKVILPHVQADQQTVLKVTISASPDGQDPLDWAEIPVTSLRSEATGEFKGAQLSAGLTYYLMVSVPETATVSIFQNVLANESWDEGLPVRFEGHDPFGGLYRGLTMEVRWPDAENKKQMFLETIAQTDYIFLPSQRAIWSTCRIPLTYPMTLDYYRALFDGRLGFEQVAAFSAPLKLGLLQISDVGGTLAWNRTPKLPLFNHSWLAAEEAFSVYDHPPVWVFKKRANFSLEKVREILEATDLSLVVNQGPREASGDWCPAQ